MRLKSGIVLSMFLTSGNVYFVFGYVYLMCICLKTAIWLFHFYSREKVTDTEFKSSTQVAQNL